MRLLLLLTFCFSTATAWAQVANETTGARARSMGGASLTLVDGWSAVNNQGALGQVTNWHAGVAYQNNYLLSGLGLKALAVTAPVGNGAFGLTGHSFGYSQYTENRIGISYGRKLSDLISLGIQINYMQWRIGDIYGQRGAVVVEAGMLVTPTEKLSLGAHVFNPNRAKLADFDNERAPTVLRIGARYEFSKVASAMLDVEKDIDRPVNIRSGIEYAPGFKHVKVRLGFATAARELSFGAGYQIKGFYADVAAHWNQFLGYGTTVSLTYKFERAKE